MVSLPIAGRIWPTLVDTGFDGDLELPLKLKGVLSCHYAGRVRSVLAGGQIVFDNAYVTELVFDGRLVEVQVLFTVAGTAILGTHLLRDYSLSINFVSQEVTLLRERTEAE